MLVYKCLLHLLLTCINFFFLDRNVDECAKAHGDKHINKMQLEYAQIASTVVRELVAKHPTHLIVPEGTYKATHKHHPVVKWATQSRAHVMWIIELGIALDKEKARRAVIALQLGREWSVTHKSQAVLKMLKLKMFNETYFEQGDSWTDPPACMPDCIRDAEANVVDAYRLYYVGPKMQVLGLAWKPYAEEPAFVEGTRKRLRELPLVEAFIEEECKKKILKNN